MNEIFQAVYQASRLAVIICLALGAVCMAEPCAKMTDAPDQVARDYLLKRGPEVTDECTAAALAKIGDAGLASDAQVLVRYLDFIWIKRQGMISVNKDNVNQLFPAVKGLIKIGRDAVPALLDTLRDAEETYSVRRNAARTIRLIYGADAPAAMEILLAAAGNEKRPAARISLLEAASWISTWCTDAQRAGCETVYQSYKAGVNSAER